MQAGRGPNVMIPARRCDRCKGRRILRVAWRMLVDDRPANSPDYMAVPCFCCDGVGALPAAIIPAGRLVGLIVGKGADRGPDAPT